MSYFKIFQISLITCCIFYIQLAVGSATVYCLGIRNKQSIPTLIVTSLFVFIASRWVLFTLPIEDNWQIKTTAFILCSLTILLIFAKTILNFKHNVSIAQYVKKHLADTNCHIGCLFIFLVSFNYLARIPSDSLPIFTLGNNDLFYFLNISNYLIDPANTVKGNLINYIHELKHDVFGVMAAIAWISNLFEHNTSAIPPLVSILLATSGISIFTISNHLLRNKYASSAISALFLFSPMVYYITGHHFLGQLFAWTTLLSLIIEEIHTNNKSFSNDLFVYLVCYGLLVFSYPAYILPLILTHYLFIILTTRGFTNPESPFTKTWIRTTFQHITVLTLQLVCAFSLLTLLFFERVKAAFFLMASQSAANNGWPLPLVKMQALLLLPFELAELQSGWSAADYSFATIALLTVIIHSIIVSDNNKRQEINLENYFAAHKFLIFLFAVFSIYILLFLLWGPSYHQWKFASFLVIPLAFIFYIIFFQVVMRIFKHSKWATFVSALTIVCITLPLDWHFTSKAALNLPTSFAKPRYFDISFSELAKLNQGTHGNIIAIDLEPFSETMLAMNFLYRSVLFPRQQTYFNRNPSWPPPTANDLIILLNRQCRKITPLDSTIGRFTTTKDLHYDSYYPFIEPNTTYNLSLNHEKCFIKRGFAVYESGIVSHGERSDLNFFSEPNNSGYVLTLSGNGFSNSVLPHISIQIQFNGLHIGSWILHDIDTTETISFVLPPSSQANQPESNTLTFTVDNPKSMSEFGFPDDGNRYGFILKSITILSNK